jgi:hypothetical protein
MMVFARDSASPVPNAFAGRNDLTKNAFSMMFPLSERAAVLFFQRPARH